MKRLIEGVVVNATERLIKGVMQSFVEQVVDRAFVGIIGRRGDEKVG